MKTTFFIMLMFVFVLALASAYGADEDPIGEALPDDFPEFIINQYGETSQGVLMGSVNPGSNEEVGKYFIIMDTAVVPVFYSKNQSL